MAIQDYKEAFQKIAELAPNQRAPYQTYVVVELIRDLAYYIILAIVVWALGRRLIHAILSAIRESRHGRA
jgi:hypothetical protein